MIHVPLVCGLSQGSSVREHGDDPQDLGWLKLGRMKDGTRSARESPAAIRARPSLASVLLSEFLQAFSVAVRTFAEKGSGPLAEVEDMVAKTHRDGPFLEVPGPPTGESRYIILWLALELLRYSRKIIPQTKVGKTIVYPSQEEKEPLSTKQIVAISIAGAVSGCSILGLIFYLIMKRIL